MENLQIIFATVGRNTNKGQMSMPNFIMVICTLFVLMMFIPSYSTQISNALAGVATSKPQYIIANLIPGLAIMLFLVGVLVYTLIRNW